MIEAAAIGCLVMASVLVAAGGAGVRHLWKARQLRQSAPPRLASTEGSRWNLADLLDPDLAEKAKAEGYRRAEAECRRDGLNLPKPHEGSWVSNPDRCPCECHTTKGHIFHTNCGRCGCLWGHWKPCARCGSKMAKRVWRHTGTWYEPQEQILACPRCGLDRTTREAPPRSSDHEGSAPWHEFNPIHSEPVSAVFVEELPPDPDKGSVRHPASRKR